MESSEILAKFLVRFVVEGFPPMHDHDSAQHKDAMASQPAVHLYLDCGHDMDLTEAILSFCVKKEWIVAPFGLLLGLGINQETFEATQKGVDFANEFIAQIDGVTNEQR